MKKGLSIVTPRFQIAGIVRQLGQHKENVVLLAAGMFFFFILFSSIDAGEHKFIAIPFMLLLTPLLIVYPRLFIVCFFGSFFLDKNVYIFEHHFSYIFINVQDVLGLLFIAGFSAKYLFKDRKIGETLQRPPASKTTRITQFLFLLLLLSSISFIVNINSFSLIDAFRAADNLFHLIELIAVFIIMMNEFSYSDRSFFINTIIAFSLAELAIVGYQYFSALSHGSYYFRDISGLFGHHCQVGNMMTISIVCSIHNLFETHLLRRKVAYLSISFLFCWAIICSGSRSNLLGIICAVGLLILSKFKFSKRYFLGTSSLALVSLFLVLFSPFKHITDFTFKSYSRGIDLSSYQRLFIWKGAWEHFVHAPFFTKLFGIGIGNYSNIKYSFFLDDGDKVASGAHNNFLHVLSETGVFGELIFLGLFSAIILALWRAGKQDPFAFLFCWATIALLISGLTQETFWFQISFGNFWMFYMAGLAMALSYPQSAGLKPADQEKTT